jgi:uncharacterized LabA/DUF88 family protein
MDMSVDRNSLPDCVVLVDAENVAPDALDSLMHWLRVRFNVVKAIGFADFTQRALIGADLALRQQGITPQHVPSQRSGRSYRKNLVDPTLIVEMMMIYAQHRHNLHTYVLASGDSHFLPMVRALRADGQYVIVAAPSRSSSHSLRRAANRFFDLMPISGSMPTAAARYGATVMRGRLQ